MMGQPEAKDETHTMTFPFVSPPEAKEEWTEEVKNTFRRFWLQNKGLIPTSVIVEDSFFRKEVSDVSRSRMVEVWRNKVSLKKEGCQFDFQEQYLYGVPPTQCPKRRRQVSYGKDVSDCRMREDSEKPRSPVKNRDRVALIHALANKSLSYTAWGKGKTFFKGAILYTWNDAPHISVPPPPSLQNSPIRGILSDQMTALYRAEMDVFTSTPKRSHVYYESGSVQENAFRFRGWSVHIYVNSHMTRLARTIDIDVASMLVVASVCDPRLHSQASLSLWCDWIVEGGEKSVHEWVSDHVVKENLSNFKARQAEGRGRNHTVAEEQRMKNAKGFDFLKAQKELFSEISLKKGLKKSISSCPMK